MEYRNCDVVNINNNGTLEKTLEKNFSLCTRINGNVICRNYSIESPYNIANNTVCVIIDSSPHIIEDLLISNSIKMGSFLALMCLSIFIYNYVNKSNGTLEGNDGLRNKIKPKYLRNVFKFMFLFYFVPCIISVSSFFFFKEFLVQSIDITFCTLFSFVISFVYLMTKINKVSNSSVDDPQDLSEY